MSTVLLVWIAILATGLFGTLSLWQLENKEIQKQILLDACTGQSILQLKQNLLQTENTVRWMQGIRISLATANLYPPARIALQSALQAQWIRIQFQKAHWVSLQVRWMARSDCAPIAIRAQTIPTFPWIQLPPDGLGPTPPVWDLKQPKSFFLSLISKPRKSHVHLFKQTDQNWQADWISNPYSPRRVLNH